MFGDGCDRVESRWMLRNVSEMAGANNQVFGSLGCGRNTVGES